MNLIEISRHVFQVKYFLKMTKKGCFPECKENDFKSFCPIGAND